MGLYTEDLNKIKITARDLRYHNNTREYNQRIEKVFNVPSLQMALSKAKSSEELCKYLNMCSLVGNNWQEEFNTVNFTKFSCKIEGFVCLTMLVVVKRSVNLNTEVPKTSAYFVNSRSMKSAIDASLDFCMSDLKKLFDVVNVDGYSLYSVGQVSRRLQNDGYDENVVNKCIVRYLRNEHVSKL